MVHIVGVEVLDVGSKLDNLGDIRAYKCQRVIFHSLNGLIVPNISFQPNPWILHNCF